jgi:aspartate racemase
MVDNKRWDELVDWLVEGIQEVYRAGAEFSFISDNA